VSCSFFECVTYGSVTNCGWIELPSMAQAFARRVEESVNEPVRVPLSFLT
jgi:hypothetical protein